ncbi:MAG: acyl-CoA thioesterase [Thermoguttaceae bacterium]|nr:acyl-CoA thioesterase [Thermoguttaceae bacterium]
MFVTTPLTPQVADSDMQGHVNFIAYSKWFDRVRTPIYRELDPTLEFNPHGMVVLKTELTFLHEVAITSDVSIRTWVSLLGVKSVELTQDVWQDGVRCAIGKTVFCGFNFARHESEPLNDAFRAVLEKYRWGDDTTK